MKENFVSILCMVMMHIADLFYISLVFFVNIKCVIRVPVLRIYIICYYL